MSTPDEKLDQMVDALLRKEKHAAKDGFSAATLARLKEEDRASATLEEHLDSLLRSQPLTAREGFTEATLERLHEDKGRRAIIRFPWLPAATAAAAALALVAVLQPWKGETDAIHTAALSNTPTQHAEAPERDPTLAAIDAEHSDLERLFLLAEGIDGADPLLKEENLRTLALLKPGT